MNLTYICNSCFVYTLSTGEKIVTDPWFDGPCNQTWFPFPPVNLDTALKAVSDPSYIYISHIHEDHLHLKTLSHFDSKTPIVIGKLNSPHLRNKIYSYGFKNVIEVPLEEKTRIGNLDWLIFSDFNGSTVGDHSDLNYDLDTSLWVFEKNNMSIFNAIDNTLLPKDSKVLRETFGSPDVAILPYASASMYPMSMENYSDEKKKNLADMFKIKFGELFIENVLNLNPKYFIPAGGEYLLGAGAAELAVFQPIPLPRDLNRMIPSEIRDNLRKMYLGDELDVRTGILTMNHKASYRDFTESDIESYSKSLQSEPMDYLSYPTPENIQWETLLKTCANNYQRAIAKRNLDLNYNIRIKLDNDCNIEFTTNSSEARNLVEFKLPSKLLFQIVTGRLNWNNLESSCLISLHREPDIYNINLHNSMVFFRI